MSESSHDNTTKSTRMLEIFMKLLLKDEISAEDFDIHPKTLANDINSIQEVVAKTLEKRQEKQEEKANDLVQFFKALKPNQFAEELSFEQIKYNKVNLAKENGYYKLYYDQLMYLDNSELKAITEIIQKTVVNEKGPDGKLIIQTKNYEEDLQKQFYESFKSPSLDMKKLNILTNAITEKGKIKFDFQRANKKPENVRFIPYYIDFSDKFYYVYGEKIDTRNERKKRMYRIENIDNISKIRLRKQDFGRDELSFEAFEAAMGKETISLFIDFNNYADYVLQRYPLSDYCQPKVPGERRKGKDIHYIKLTAINDYPLKRWMLSQGEQIRLLTYEEAQEKIQPTIDYEGETIDVFEGISKEAYDELYVNYVEFLMEQTKFIQKFYPIKK